MPSVAVRSLFALGILFSPPLAAEIPSVTGVLNQGSGASPLSPGVLALVSGANFHEAAMVMAGGRPAPVFEYLRGEPDQGLEDILRVQLPVELTAGPTTLVVTTFAGTSEPFEITLEDFGPALAGFVDRSGGAPVVFSCFPPITAAPGATLTVTAMGLGPTDPLVPTGTAPGVAVPTVAKPTLSVSGQAAEVLESVLSPDNVGVYWVTFRIPEAQGGQDVSLSIGGATSNNEFLLVGRAALNLTSAWLRGAAAPESIQVVRSCGIPFLEPDEPGSGNPSFVGETLNPPTTLGGVTVRVTDSGGVERLAPLLYVSPLQINYLIPAGTVDGYATVVIGNSEGGELAGTVEIHSVAPVLFGAALVARLQDGVQTVQIVYPETATGGGRTSSAPISDEGERLDGLPIELGPESDQVYLVLFATGLRFRSSPAAVVVSIGGENASLEYAGAQNEFAGLDQLNIRLPRVLFGRGEVELRLTVDGTPANAMYLTVQ